MVDVSERSFEEAIECGLLQGGSDPGPGDATTAREAAPAFRGRAAGRLKDRDFFMRSGPGTVKLPRDSAAEYIRARFVGYSAANP